MVFETPPDSLGLFDDLWFRWVIDFGAPGPDRGMGGKYLLLPPGYDGPLPDGGYFIGNPTTTSVALLGRSFLVNDDPKPTVETIKSTLKLYLRSRIAERHGPPDRKDRRAVEQARHSDLVEGTGLLWHIRPALLRLRTRTARRCSPRSAASSRRLASSRASLSIPMPVCARS
jgi:hypothetical protein